jgi:hypothetical protein
MLRVVHRAGEARDERAQERQSRHCRDEDRRTCGHKSTRESCAQAEDEVCHPRGDGGDPAPALIGMRLGLAMRAAVNAARLTLWVPKEAPASVASPDPEPVQH